MIVCVDLLWIWVDTAMFQSLHDLNLFIKFVILETIFTTYLYLPKYGKHYTVLAYIFNGYRELIRGTVTVSWKVSTLYPTLWWIN